MTIINWLLSILRGPVAAPIRPVVPKQCIDLIKKFEGFRAAPYLDSVNVPTIGYGTTYYKDGRLVKLSDQHVTESEAEELLEHHAYSFFQQVKELTKAAPLDDNQLSALTSFAYNLGVGALLKSTLLKLVRANPADPNIRTEFGKWVNAGGKKLEGLVRRRKAEADLYFS